MNQHRFARLLASAFVVCALSGSNLFAQCPVTTVTGGLLAPTKIIASAGDLLVAESGFGPNMGRITALNPQTGEQHPLIGGLPSGITPPNNDPSGPSGLVFRGNTLYVIIGLGDAIVNGSIPNTQVPAPHPSSPIFSSLLALRFDHHYQTWPGGFNLTLADQVALKNGLTVNLTNSEGEALHVRLIADLPDYSPEPVPGEPNNVRQSNPFGAAIFGNSLYIPDASNNTLRAVDLDTGAARTVTAFAPIPNPLPFGPPVSEPVPNSIQLVGDRLLVTLLTGFPFAPGSSQVRSVDPSTGQDAAFISGLTSSIDVAPFHLKRTTGFLTLEFSADMLSGAPGRMRFYDSPNAQGTVVADCLITPTSMAVDERSGDVFVTEIFTGRVVKVALH